MNRAWLAYRFLMADPPRLKGLERLTNYEEFDGVSVPNYTIVGECNRSWIDDEGQSSSGIFVAGDTKHENRSTYYLGHDDETLTGLKRECPTCKRSVQWQRTDAKRPNEERLNRAPSEPTMLMKQLTMEKLLRWGLVGGDKVFWLACREWR